MLLVGLRDENAPQARAGLLQDYATITKENCVDPLHCSRLSG